MLQGYTLRKKKVRNLTPICLASSIRTILKFERVTERLNIAWNNGTRPFDSTDSRVDNKGLINVKHFDALPRARIVCESSDAEYLFLEVPY
ncbi:hypothetical protein P5V15_002379 [Pogonomyrmex californicus]